MSNLMPIFYFLKNIYFYDFIYITLSLILKEFRKKQIIVININTFVNIVKLG